MTTGGHRRLGAWLIAGGVVVAQGALVAAMTAHASADQPPGNNGTVKVENADIDSLDDESPANHPHVSCPFAVRWYGYDTGTRAFEVAFEAQPPSGNAATAILSGDASGTFEGSGPGNTDPNHQVVYELDTTDLYFQPNQGYHIKMTVTTDGSQGNDTKHKTFWMDACAEESPSPTPSVEPTTPSAEPTTESPSVLPTVIESSPSISPSVQGVKIVKPPAVLPHTGPSVNTMVAMAGVLLILASGNIGQEPFIYFQF